MAIVSEQGVSIKAVPAAVNTCVFLCSFEGELPINISTCFLQFYAQLKQDPTVGCYQYEPLTKLNIGNQPT